MYQTSILFVLALSLASCQSAPKTVAVTRERAVMPNWLAEMNTGCFTPNRQSKYQTNTMTSHKRVDQIKSIDDRNEQAGLLEKAYGNISARIDVQNAKLDENAQRPLDDTSAHE